MKRQISPERQNAYYLGMGITALGVLLTIVGFITFVALGVSSVDDFGDSTSPLIGFFMFFAGMVLTGIGAFVQNAAARGLAGSGLKLDPEQARRDVEPWSRMAGGVFKDAIDETGLLKDSGDDFDTQLRKLHQLQQEGIISKEEYEKAKSRILESEL